MTKNPSQRAHVATLVADIRDCARRATIFGLDRDAARLHEIADSTDRAVAEERESILPPVLASNQQARTAASKCFKEARRILQGIK
jgi:microcystin degradation protein MlrC